MDLKELVDFVKGWRVSNKISGNAPLDNTQLAAFANVLDHAFRFGGFRREQRGHELNGVMRLEVSALVGK